MSDIEEHVLTAGGHSPNIIQLHRRRKMFQLGREGTFSKVLYRLRNISLTVIHNITSYVKVPKLGGGGESPPCPSHFLRL